MESSSARGAVLVVVAHPDDEALGFSGVIAHALAAGRRVRVALATNGDTPTSARRFGGPIAARRAAAKTRSYGALRTRETVAAMGVLGLRWRPDPAESDILFLGYPDRGLVPIAASQTPWTGDGARLHRTYASADGRLPGDHDLRHLLDGRHSRLCAEDLARDFDSLLELTEPADVYTHAGFDGHADHAEVHRQLVAAVERRRLTLTVHSTLIHPEGTEDCLYHSALQWPNPPENGAGPDARFTPELPFEPPPVPAGAEQPTGASWGPLGPPDERIEVPEPMLAADPDENLKWRVIAQYRSQVRCERDADGRYHASCGYLRAFVKREEFFWTRTFAENGADTPFSPPSRTG